ncbi:uncharacterized protein RAG0_15986 [Rhynchosporium agropyri]|uniref:Reverse transcriptase Ty1/copia-type domain-containing protein n=1 Tax=Rhynchosporium agropyri TaxID=914238 RepID=A0A1E1LND1_9HELO|nr:uncharacterized protein RAG0_15986 [Rhynchosporium agropyri]
MGEEEGIKTKEDRTYDTILKAKEDRTRDIVLKAKEEKGAKEESKLDFIPIAPKSRLRIRSPPYSSTLLVKLIPSSLIDRFKARLIAEGFSQRLDKDYLETFSPTLKMESLRIVLAIVAFI